MNIFSKKKQRGFTLLETIIACFMVAIGAVGAYTVFSQITNITSLSASRLTAAYLAQEGIEIVRNIRDSNWLQSEDWNNGLTGCADGCQIDYSGFSEADPVLPPYNGAQLKIDTNGFYNYLNGTPTQYKRKITITLNSDGTNDILKVVAEVFWNKGSVKVQENLYDWR